MYSRHSGGFFARSVFSPLPKFVASLKSGISAGPFSFASGAMIFLLI